MKTFYEWTFIDGFSMYLKYVKINFLTNLQYKGWPIMFFSTLLTVITDPIATFFLFARFGNVGDWSIERIMLVYAMAVTSYGLAEGFFRGYDYFPWRMIRSGDFDRLLLRPRTLFVQIAAAYFHIHRFARVAGGLFAIIWSLSRMGIVLGPVDIIMLLLALIGGMLAYGGIFVLISGIAFYTIQGLDWISIVTNGSYQVTRCPIEYLPKALRYFFTFFIPMFVVSYYPAAAVCGWGEPYWKGFLALPAGLGFMLISICVWRVGVGHYKSTGS